MCICAHCLVVKDIYSVSACKRSSKLISSGLLINTLCSMEYLINAHTLMLLSSPCLSWMHMGVGRMTAGSLGFRLLTRVSSRWCAEDGPPDCYGPSSHVITVDTVGDVAAAAAATPPDYCFHWSVGAKPSALHHCWSFLVHLSIQKLTEEHPSIRLNVPLSDAPNHLIELRPGFCQRWFFQSSYICLLFCRIPPAAYWYMDRPIQEDGWWVNNIDIYILANQIMQREQPRWMALVVEMGLKMEPEKRSLGFSTTNFRVCVSHLNECGYFSSHA